MKKTVLSILIFLSLSNTFKQTFPISEKDLSKDIVEIIKSNERNILWNVLKTAFYHSAFLAPVAINTYRHLNAENILKNNFTKIEDEKIVNFAQNACSKITNQKINFYTGNTTKFFGLPAGYLAASVGEKDIIIEPDYYEVIKEYIYDETKENRDIVLNIFTFLMQHEAGHLKNNDSKSRFIRSIVIYLAKICLFESSKKIINFKASQLLTFLSLNTVDIFISGYLNKQQEYLADACIVGIDAINGGKQLFTNLINLEQSNSEAYWNMKLDPNHPSNENRLKSLQELEQAV